MESNYNDRRMEPNYNYNDRRMEPNYNNRRMEPNYDDRRMEPNDKRELDDERGNWYRNEHKIPKDLPEHEKRRLQDERVFFNDRRSTGLREGEWVCKLCSMLLLPYKNSKTPKPKCPRCGIKSLNPWFQPGDWCCPKCNYHNKAGDDKNCTRSHCEYVFDEADVSVGVCK